MGYIAKLALQKVAVVMMLVLLIVAGGIFSASKLQTELLPDISFPVVSVTTFEPGASPGDVEHDITIPIEQAIATTSGVKTIQSSSNQNLSIVIAQYDFGTDIDKVTQKVNDALNKTTLPGGVKPQIGRFSFADFPIMQYAVVPARDITPEQQGQLKQEILEKILPDLQAVPGVSSISLGGGGSDQFVVALDPQKLADSKISLTQITQALQGNNIAFPAGQITTNTQVIPIEITHRFSEITPDPQHKEVIAQLKNIVVGVKGLPASATGGPDANKPISSQDPNATGNPATTVTGGPPTPVTLGDLAEVRFQNSGGESISRTNGKRSLSLTVYKAQDANTVDVSDGVTAKMAEVAPRLGANFTIVNLDNQADFIKISINGMIREGVLGAIFAVLVIFVFLFSIRSTLVTAVSIPLSILMAFILLKTTGISLNIMSLGGLAVAVGRVVDDSIVVLENIYRHVQRGEPVRSSAYTGTKEVASAITSSTLTTTAVFLPLGFTGGIISKFFLPFALTVVFSLLASLIVALTVIPVLAVIFIKPPKILAGQAQEVVEKETIFQRVYTPILSWTLRSWKTKSATLGSAFLLLMLSFALLGYGISSKRIPVAFISSSSQKLLDATITLPVGTDLQTTGKEMAKVEGFLAGRPAASNYTLTIGNTGSTQDASRHSPDPNFAYLTIHYKDDADLAGEQGALTGFLDTLKANGELTVAQVAKRSGGGPGGDFAVQVTGGNYADVKTASQDITELMRKHNNGKGLTGLDNLHNDIGVAKPEIRVTVDPTKAVTHGASAILIAGQVRSYLNGQTVTSVNLADRNYDVVAMYDPTKINLNSIDSLKNLKVGIINPVALSEVATIEQVDGPVSIPRINEQRASTISGVFTGEDTRSASTEAQQIINDYKGSAAYHTLASAPVIAISGASQAQAQSFQDMGFALLIAIVLVYIIMVAAFGSLLNPFAIMFSLPLAAIGAIVALFATGRSLGLSSLIGLLMLIGIVVTNAIVLVDRVEQNQRRGEATREALIDAGRTRIRPILMTAIATILALVPLALGFSEGAIIAAELATVVIGGLVTSTFLTLLIIPVIYSIFASWRGDDRKHQFRITQETPQSEPEVEQEKDLVPAI